MKMWYLGNSYPSCDLVELREQFLVIFPLKTLLKKVHTEHYQHLSSKGVRKHDLMKNKWSWQEH